MKAERWTVTRRLTDLTAYFQNAGKGRHAATTPRWDW